ncbi:MAG: tetratricopeptide repeat protein [Vicinamibacteria bacterium]
MSVRGRAGLAVVLWLGSAGLQAAEPKWSVARSPRFTVVGPVGEREVREKAYELEQFHGLVSSALNLRTASTRPVVVFAVPGAEEMRTALGGASGKAVPDGFFRRGDTHQIVVRLDLPGDDTLHHEYVHLLNSLNFGRLPLWLDEGLAGFYSTAVLEGDRVRYAQVSPIAIAVLRHSPLLPLSRLLAAHHGSPEYGGTHRPAMFHVQSAVLTHYLMMDERGAHRRMLAEYLNQLAAGATDEQAEQRAFGGAEALDKAFSSYARRFQFFSVRANGTFDPQAITTAPLSAADALAYQATLELGGRREDSARSLAERAVAADPRSALAQRVLGQTLADARPVEALAAFERAAAADPADLMTHYYLGTTENGADDADAARRERSLRKGLAIQPKHAPSRAALARLLRRAGRTDEALGNATVAFDQEPQEPQFALVLAEVLRAAGRGPEADAVEGRVVQAAHTDPAKLAAAAFYLERNERATDRDALLQKTFAAKPRSAPVLGVLGHLFEEAGRSDDAEAVYRHALAVNPQDVSALNALGYLNAERNVRVPEALGHIEAALKIVPDDPDLLDSRGWALFRLNRLPDAERDLRRAAAGAPVATVLDHLAQVLAARGAAAEARAQWTKALAADQLSPKLKAAIEARLAGSAAAPPARP